MLQPKTDCDRRGLRGGSRIRRISRDGVGQRRAGERVSPQSSRRTRAARATSVFRERLASYGVRMRRDAGTLIAFDRDVSRRLTIRARHRDRAMPLSPTSCQFTRAARRRRPGCLTIHSAYFESRDRHGDPRCSVVLPPSQGAWVEPLDLCFNGVTAWATGGRVFYEQ